ncbi:MAG: hypothetical protein O7E52_00110, partial [Candidatus Poribacteria bacterium]|nr:hypothetical protein [Candidatus Poribacteria bacterium]
MGLIYIEYISRRPEVDVETFRSGASQGQEGWDSGYGEDQLVLSLGRTWRLGPEPEYLAVWYSPEASFDRIDAWDRIFRSGDADGVERPFFQVARIDVAGCYAPLIEPIRARDGTYYAEFFRAESDLDAVRTFYAARAQRHHHFTLNLLAYRIGKLGPEPGGLAVWTIPNFAALGEIAQEL